MSELGCRHLPVERDAIAPDGCDVRVLLRLAGGSMAHFQIGPDQVSTAVAHLTVEEIWYFLSGRGQMWRKDRAQASIVELHAGVCLTVPSGVHFQLRSFGPEPLAAIGVTMPPWPGDGEAIVVPGEWRPTVP